MDRTKAIEILEKMRENGFSDYHMLDYLIANYLSGSDATEAMQSCAEEFGVETEEE